MGVEDRLSERTVMGAVVGDTLMAGLTANGSFQRCPLPAKGAGALALSHTARPIRREHVRAERARLTRELEEESQRRGALLSSSLGAFVDFAEVELERLGEVDSYEAFPAYRSLRGSRDRGSHPRRSLTDDPHRRPRSPPGAP